MLNLNQIVIHTADKSPEPQQQADKISSFCPFLYGWGAAFAFARTRVPAADLFIPAPDDKDSVVRLRSAWALGRIGDQHVTDRLISALQDGD